MKERKNVTWRVAEHSESEKINKWLDQQRNIQESIANIVLHMIDQYGYVNITDYQVQKQLHGKTAGAKHPVETEKEADQQEVDQAVEQNSKMFGSEKESDAEDVKQEKTKEDLFDGLDPNNL